MTISAIPKRLALRFLPDGILRFVKRIHYARVLRRATENDEPDLRVVNFLTEPGQFVVDVGANIGIYTKYLSERVGPFGKVVSVEPIPLTFDILRSNVRKLGLRNVELCNFALSDAESQMRMRVPKYDSGGDNFYEARIESEEEGGCERSLVVSTTTADVLLSAAQAVHFIKCDVEGHELSCIKGALGIIERSRPAWLIEISGNMSEKESRAHQTVTLLRGYGYGVFWFDGTRLKAWGPGAAPVNYFFLTDDHVKVLRDRGFPIGP